MERQHMIEGNVLVKLHMKKAIDRNSAILLSELGVTRDDLKRLINEKRIEIFANSPERVFLTGIGDVVAMGECSLRMKRK